MDAYNLSSTRVKDPYCYVALASMRQTFRDIESYYMGDGTPEERKEGKRSIDWIRKMQGNFRLFSSATEMPLENFHQACIEQINFIKTKAYARQQLQKQEQVGSKSRRSGNGVLPRAH
jgi:hypothetical protein